MAEKKKTKPKLRHPGQRIIVPLATLPGISPALSDASVALTHIGPGKAREWSFALAKINAEAKARGCATDDAGNITPDEEAVTALHALGVAVLQDCNAEIRGLDWDVQDHVSELRRLALVETLIFSALGAQRLEDAEAF